MSSNTETYRFEGRVTLHRGEIVKILSTIQDESDPIRVTRMENFTANTTHESRLERMIMANEPRRLREPIIGRVKSSEDRGIDDIIFTIEEGRFEDYVFIRAGQRTRARDLILDIFRNQLDLYVKICDNYVNVETIKLLSYVPTGVTVLIISDNLKNKDKQDIQLELSKLQQHKVLIRKTDVQHDRIIITHGKGWSVGHSLKDLGSKNSHVQMMRSASDAEQTFDDDWMIGTVYLEHNKGKP